MGRANSKFIKQRISVIPQRCRCCPVMSMLFCDADVGIARTERVPEIKCAKTKSTSPLNHIFAAESSRA